MMDHSSFHWVVSGSLNSAPAMALLATIRQCPSHTNFHPGSELDMKMRLICVDCLFSENISQGTCTREAAKKKSGAVEIQKKAILHPPWSVLYIYWGTGRAYSQRWLFLYFVPFFSFFYCCLLCFKTHSLVTEYQGRVGRSIGLSEELLFLLHLSRD